MIKNLKWNWLVSSKLTWWIWQILTRALKNLQNLHFNELILTKIYNAWVKMVQRNYRGVMFDGTEKWCKMWKKTDLCFQKRDEWFDKFSPGHSKVSKSGSYCIITMNNDFFYRLKNSDFILESKMAELN